MLNESYYQRKAFIASVAYTAFFRASKDFSQLEDLAESMSVEVLVGTEISRRGITDAQNGEPLDAAILYHFNDPYTYWVTPPAEFQVVMNRVNERFQEAYAEQGGENIIMHVGHVAAKLTDVRAGNTSVLL